MALNASSPHRRSISLAAALMLTAAQPCYGQTAAPIAVQRPDTDTGEIIVTARKVAENIQNVPIAMSQFSGVALERQSVRSIGDIQYQLPNVQFQQSTADPQGLTIAMRGQRQNDTPPTVDPSVGVYIDGVYYPRTIGLKGALLDIDHVEVLRGPQGTLYGRNTTGGAFSIYSKNPTDEFEAFATTELGNYDLMSASAMANIPINATMALRLVGQFTKRSGFGKDLRGQDLNKENSQYIRAKLRVEIGSAEAILSLSHQKNQSGAGNFGIFFVPASVTGSVDGGSATLEVASELGLPFTPEGLAQASGILKSYQQRSPYRSGGTADSLSLFKGDVISLDLKVPLTSGITLRSITAYEHLKRATSDDHDSSPFSILDLKFANEGHYVSQELQLLGGDSHFNWVLGAYAGDEKQNYRETGNILTVLTGGAQQISQATVNNKNIAGFGQVIWEFLPRTRLTGGIRYSSDKRINNSSNTFGPPGSAVCVIPAPGVAVTGVPTDPNNGPSQCPRKFSATFSKPSWLISLDHRFSSDFFSYAKVAYGFRTGGLNFRGANFAASFEPFGPETVTEYEVGAKWDIVPRLLRLNVAAFHDDYKGAQRSITIAGPNGSVLGLTTNAASGKVDGVEGEAWLTPAKGLNLQGSFGYLDARYNTFIDLSGDRSNETFGVPKWTLSGSISYAIDTTVGQVTPQVDYHWQSQVVIDPSVKFTPASVTQRGFGLLNARVSFDFDAQQLTAAVWSKNLADKVYLSNASVLETSLGFNQLIYGEPRTWGVSLTKRF